MIRIKMTKTLPVSANAFHNVLDQKLPAEAVTVLYNALADAYASGTLLTIGLFLKDLDGPKMLEILRAFEASRAEAKINTIG